MDAAQEERPVHERYGSETRTCRESLAPFCRGMGIDVGYGGDPIVPHAICMDRGISSTSRANCGDVPQHLTGDATALAWFRDGVLDWVYSSHCLEDFQDTTAVLREWLRVLRPGGLLVLYCPDEPTYRAHCQRTGQAYNAAHVHADFGAELVKGALRRCGVNEIVHERFPVGGYSFELVARKPSAGNGPGVARRPRVVRAWRRLMRAGRVLLGS